MKNTTKRFFTIILSLTLIITMVPLKVLANEFSYSEIIQPQYDEARNFSEGLAAVMMDGKWGYIDLEGDTIIEFKYDMAYSFTESKAVVGIEKEKEDDDYYNSMYWGIVDRDGKYVPLTRADGSRYYTFVYEENTSKGTDKCFYNGAILMGEWVDSSLFGPDGKEILSISNYIFSHVPTEGIVPAYGEATDFRGYIDEKTGEVLFQDKFFGDVRPFNQGLAPVFLYDYDDDTFTYDEYWTFIDKDGNLWNDIRFSNFYVKNLYREYKVFNDNSLASVMNFDDKWGAIDKTGKTVLPFKYDKLNIFSEGLAAFSKDGKSGFIDTEGNEIIKPQFDDASAFINGLAVVRIGDTAYCIDKTGKKIDGSDSLPVDSYFVESGYDDNGDPNYVVYSPGKYVVIGEDDKFGFGKIDFTPSLPIADEMSSWALKEVKSAVKNNLVPISLQNMYKSDINRNDFAALVVKVIEEITEKDINDLVKEKTGEGLYELVCKYPFEDTTNQNVIAAQALGIINGKSEEIFAPYDTISRQDAASLLMRTAKFLGKDFASEGESFNDSENISNYAKEAVNYVSGLGIMKDKGDNNFAPKDNYSREQAYMTINRLYNVLIAE